MSNQGKQGEAADAYLALAVLLSGNFVTVLDAFIVNVALPEIQRDLGASNAELQVIMVSYGIVYGTMLLNGARMGDCYGRRKLFLFGMAIFAFGSLFCALAMSAWLLIAARAIQGLGASLLMPQVYASLRLLFDGDKRRRAFAVMGAVQGIAGVASQTIGGSLIALDIGNLSWRLIFLVNLPVAAYALIAGRSLLTETKAVMPTRLDIVGALLGGCALLSLLLPLSIGREQGWPWWAIVALTLSFPLVTIFAIYENRLTQRGGVPIIEISLFNSLNFSTGMSIGFLFYSAISSFSLSLTILLQIGFGETPLRAALIFLPSTVAFFIGAIASAPAVRHLGWHALALGMLVFAIGLTGSALGVFVDHWRLLALSASVILQGFGQGVVIPLLLNIVLSAIDSSRVGMASGAFSVAQTVGSSCGVTIVGLILFSSIDDRTSALSRTQAYTESFALATIYNIVAVSLSLLLLMAVRKGQEFSKDRKLTS